jgi:hypothetical protein
LTLQIVYWYIAGRNRNMPYEDEDEEAEANKVTFAGQQAS